MAANTTAPDITLERLVLGTQAISSYSPCSNVPSSLCSPGNSPGSAELSRSSRSLVNRGHSRMETLLEYAVLFIELRFELLNCCCRYCVVILPVVPVPDTIRKEVKQANRKRSAAGDWSDTFV